MQTLPAVSRVGIVAKSHLRAASPHLAEIAAWLESRGAHAVFEAVTATLIPSGSYREVVDREALLGEVDLILVLGGDGTLLALADQIGAAGSSVPILGINFGSLGFLTEVTLPELYSSLEAAITGRAHVEERLMLRSTTLRKGRTFCEHVALNDVVITRSARGRMVDLSVSVGDEFVTRVKADGLIIATPTGSTAYNLAAGGPIVQPSVEALILTPISPHTLTNRPVVIPSNAAVRVQARIEDRDEVFVTFDGQTRVQLEADDEVLVRRGEPPLHLVRPSTRSYFEVLRQKLKWGER